MGGELNRTLLLLALLGAVAGCRKPLPSPDFIEASGAYTDLVAVRGDDSYTAPEMDAIVTQLGRVPEKSKDFTAARSLLDTISKERVRIAAVKAAALAVLNAPVPPPNFPPLPVAPPEPTAPPAPPAPADPFAVVVGADWPTLEKKFVGCMVSRGSITLTNPDGGGARDTEGFELSESPDCRTRVPALATSLAIVQNGKIVLLAPKTMIVSTAVPAPVAPVAPPVAPPPPVTPPPPLPPGSMGYPAPEPPTPNPPPPDPISPIKF